MSKLSVGIVDALRYVYGEWKDLGLLSIYVWGSILSDDFDINHSDIDIIGIAADRLSITTEEEIQKYLENKKDNFKKIGFRILYLSEMDGGEIKSNLAEYIPPKLLAHDFPAWRHVCGRKFKQSDFSIGVPTKEEAIQIQLRDIEKEINWTIESKDSQYVVKAIARLVDYSQNKRHPETPFSYKMIYENAGLGIEQETVNAIMDCKKSGWSSSLFDQHYDTFTKYINSFR